MAPRPGRNDPCPCGSGKKYKRCCIAKDEVPATPTVIRDPGPLLDDKLVDEMLLYGDENFGAAATAKRAFEEECDGDSKDVPLFIPWALYHYAVKGRTIAEWYVRDCGSVLSRARREWLESQRRALLTFWEVAAVDPGRTLTLRGLLTGREHTIREQTASRILSRWHVLLGRVVEYDGKAYLVGAHVRPLPPREAAVARDMVLEILEIDGPPVPEDLLRSPESAAASIRAWGHAVALVDAPPEVPKLVNTDGHELVFISDRYSFEPSRRQEVAEGVSALKGASPDPEKDGEIRITFTRPGNKTSKELDNTIVGSGTLGADTLTLETNSAIRAATLLRRVKKACPDMLRPVERTRKAAEHLLRQKLKESEAAASDEGDDAAAPGAAMANSLVTGPATSGVPAPVPPEALRMARELMEKMNRAWPDEKVPALGGLTPRKAARSPRWRPVLEVMLKEMEQREARRPVEERTDIAYLWRELGLG